MGLADQLRMSVDGDYITISGENYLAPTQLPRALLDEQIARYERAGQSGASDFQKILDDYAQGKNTKLVELLGGVSGVTQQRDLAAGQSVKLDPYNLDERYQNEIANQILTSQGMMGDVHSARDEYVNSQKSEAFGGFMKWAPLALAGFGGALALAAPAAAGGAAAGGAATSAGTISGAGGLSNALLAAPSGLGAGAGYSATLGSAAAGGLGATLGNFASKQALSGAVKGGISGYASGGDLSSALKGAGLGGLTGGYGNALGTAAELGEAGRSALTSGLVGASGSLANGDIRGAALGGAAGAGMGYYQGGGFGNTAGTALDKASGIAGAQGPTQGTGLAGAVTRTTNPITNSLSNFTGGGGSSFTGGNMNNLGQALKLGGSIYGDYTNRQTNKDIERRLLDANSQAAEQMQPYQQAGLSAQNQLSQALAAGFNPSDLQNDPGYQFQLEQGERALGRGMSAQGMTQSGAALKALQEHGQGVASTRYNDAYNQWLQQNQQLQGVANTGMGAAGGLAELQYNSGQAQADRLNKNRDSRSELIASLTGMFA